VLGINVSIFYIEKKGCEDKTVCDPCWSKLREDGWIDINRKYCDSDDCAGVLSPMNVFCIWKGCEQKTVCDPCWSELKKDGWIDSMEVSLSPCSLCFDLF